MSGDGDGLRARQFILRSNPNKHRPDPTQLDLNEVEGVLKEWKGKQSQIWSLRWGVGLLGLSSSLTATFVNWHFRETLYLLKTSRVTSYVSMFGVPGLTAAACHYMFVRRHILVPRPHECSVCLQVRGMLIQGMSGILYPLLLAPVISYPVARRLESYSVPLSASPSTLLKFTMEVLRPVKGSLWVLGAVQVLLGMTITYAEQLSFTQHLQPTLLQTKPKLSPYDHRNIIPQEQ